MREENRLRVDDLKGLSFPLCRRELSWSANTWPLINNTCYELTFSEILYWVITGQDHTELLGEKIRSFGGTHNNIITQQLVSFPLFVGNCFTL